MAFLLESRTNLVLEQVSAHHRDISSDFSFNFQAVKKRSLPEQLSGMTRHLRRQIFIFVEGTLLRLGRFPALVRNIQQDWVGSFGNLVR